MQDINKILASLSPEKRAILEKKLKKDSSKYNSFPLSFAQKRLWFLDQLEPGSTAYNIPSAVRLKGNLNLDYLQKSINTIINRHEILRTSIISASQDPVQIIHKNVIAKIEEVDLSSLDYISREQNLKEEISKSSYIYFNLSNFPLFKNILFKLDEDDSVLLIIMHHIISDGWSVNIFVRELSEIYNALSADRKPQLPKLSIQYVDYAKWQKQWLKSDEYQALLKFWLNYLEGGSPKLKLPYDTISSEEDKVKGNNILKVLTSKKVKQIETICKENNVSVFMFFAAVINILLFKFTSQNDISIGTPVANRNKASVQDLIGFFVNLIVLRVTINPNLSFEKFLLQIKEIALNAFDRQEMPFENLVEEIQPERNLNSTPLFNVMYSFTNRSNDKLVLPNLTLSQVEIDFESTQYDLTFNISENEHNEIQIYLEFNKRLFLESTVNRLLENFSQLVNSILQNTKEKIYNINILSKSDFSIINKNFKNIELVQFDSIPQQFEEIVKQYSNKIAVQHKNSLLTYGELNKSINELANYLKDHYKLKNQLVGVFLDNSIEYVISILAILKSGNAYLPIDIHYPSKRINQIIEQSRVDTILTDSKYINALKGKNIRIISLNGEAKLIATQNSNNPKVTINDIDYAYCIFTSGSTGQPKGVLISHKNLSTFVKAAKEIYKLESDDKILQFASNSFDTSVEEIFTALTSGATLVIKTSEMLSHANIFFKNVKNEKITILDLPTAYFSQLTHQMMEESLSYPQSLKKIIIGGEKLAQSVFQEWNQLNHSQVELFNSYGPTETTVVATIWHNKAYPIVKLENEIPIGIALKGYTSNILDAYLKPVPIGVVGELYIGGDGVAAGYIYDPVFTSVKFIPDPFSRHQGQRLYKTGDLVKLLPDGNIEFIGRSDGQVKIRGFRVEPSEIERALQTFNKIKESKIIIDENSFIDHRINAYLLSDEDLNKDIHAIRRFLKEKLPHYMLPSKYFQIEDMPLTLNGKIDTKKLLECDNDIIINEETDQSLSSIQFKVINILKDILKISKLNLSDNFFEMGGHSLLATHLTGIIKKEFNVNFSVRMIFEAIDIAEIVTKIEKLQDQQLKVSFITKSEERVSFPLSFAQQRLWFLSKLDGENSVYNIPTAVKLKGTINLDLLKKSLDKLIERHEILRTTFETENGIPFQKIHNSFNAVINVIDIQSENYTDKEGRAAEICVNESSKGFELDQLPLFKVFCIIINSDEVIIFTNIHHIISDGWSDRIIITEILTFYFALIKNKNLHLPDLPFQYGDYSKWQRDRLKGEELTRHLDFWKKYLEAAPSYLKLPIDKKRPEVQTNNGEILSIELKNIDKLKLNNILSETKSTQFMFFLSIFKLLMYRLTNQEDIIIGTPVANRENSDVQNLVGLFVNTIAIRTDFSTVNTFFELLSGVRKSSINVFGHKELPFEKILETINIERNTSYSPLFQTMFTFNHYEKPLNKFEEIEYSEFEFKVNSSKFDLNITIQETQDENYSCGFEYNTDLFNRETIENWAGYYNTLVNEIIEDHEQHLLTYSLKYSNTIEDQYYKNYEYNNILEKIALHALTQSNKAALIHEGIKISYSQLQNLINHLANSLLRVGVSYGEYVGIYLNRSIQYVISMFALQKIGAAFVPLDIKSPIERNQYIVQDAKLKFVITSEELNETLTKDINIIDINSLIKLDEIYDRIEFLKNNNHKELAAYVIYTSGTSGKPKGVLVSNNNISSFTQAAISNYKITEDDIILQFASMGFDTALEEIFPIIFKGGTVVLRNDDIIASNSTLLSVIENSNLTVLDLPTAYWHQLISEMIKSNLNFPSCLKKIIIGGEKASIDNMDKWIRSFSKELILLNTYGPTEATVVATLWSPNNNTEYSNEVPIGKAIKNSKIFVLDKNLNEVTTNVVGELYLGGQGISLGYLNDSVKTAANFFPNHFSAEYGERIYKTGDLVRKLPSGNLEFIGRVDSQVKIRGFRVELAEIEQAVSKIKDVEEACVVLNSSAETERLVCFYKSKEEIKYDIFRERLKGTLPDYMIPTAFIKISEMPITLNGKVDKKKLEKQDFSQTKTKKVLVQPNTEKEKILLKIWQEILKNEKIGITDNFFELGGDSIIGIQVISKARQNGLAIKPVHLFQYQSIKELALVASDKDIITAEQGRIMGVAKLTPIQKLFFESNFENPNHWNQSLLFTVKQDLDTDIVRKTITKLIDHHDALRTKIIIGNAENEYQQEFQESFDKSVFIEYNIENVEDKEAKIYEICSENQRSLNIENGQIIKIVLIRLNKNEVRLFFVVHHMVIDGVSWRILLEDFQSIYTQQKSNSTIILPPKTTSIKEWSQKLYSFSKSEKIKKEKNFWLIKTSLVKNFLPIDFESGINNEKSTTNATFNLSEEETHSLITEVNTKYNTKINDLLLTALLRSYSAWSGKRSITLNMENHGRDLPIDKVDVSRTIGWFTALYPCHLDLQKTVDVGDSIKIVKEQLRSIPNSGNTYGIIRFLSEDKSLINKLKVFDNLGITFNYLGQFDNVIQSESILSISNERKGDERDPNNIRDSIIDITGNISGGKLRINFSYSKNIFKDETINAWTQKFRQELIQIIEHCKTKEDKTFTSSDFDLSNLSDKKLDKVLSKLKKK